MEGTKVELNSVVEEAVTDNKQPGDLRSVQATLEDEQGEGAAASVDEELAEDEIPTETKPTGDGELVPEAVSDQPADKAGAVNDAPVFIEDNGEVPSVLVAASKDEIADSDGDSKHGDGNKVDTRCIDDNEGFELGEENPALSDTALPGEEVIDPEVLPDETNEDSDERIASKAMPSQASQYLD